MLALKPSSLRRVGPASDAPTSDASASAEAPPVSGFDVLLAAPVSPTLLAGALPTPSGTGVLSDQVSMLGSLMPLVEESATPKGTTLRRQSAEVLFGTRYDDEDILIADITDVDEVRAKDSRPPASLARVRALAAAVARDASPALTGAAARVWPRCMRGRR